MLVTRQPVGQPVHPVGVLTDQLIPRGHRALVAGGVEHRRALRLVASPRPSPSRRNARSATCSRAVVGEKAWWSWDPPGPMDKPHRWAASPRCSLRRRIRSGQRRFRRELFPVRQPSYAIRLPFPTPVWPVYERTELFLRNSGRTARGTWREIRRRSPGVSAARLRAGCSGAPVRDPRRLVLRCGHGRLGARSDAGTCRGLDLGGSDRRRGARASGRRRSGCGDARGRCVALGAGPVVGRQDGRRGGHRRRGQRAVAAGGHGRRRAC